MFRFAIKVGLATGAVYYLKEEGIWKDSKESLKVYDKLNTTLDPYIKEIKEQIPVELPKLTYNDQNRYALREYWNKGVGATFEFLIEFPGNASTWTSSIITAILEHPDVQKVIEASSTTTEPLSQKK